MRTSVTGFRTTPIQDDPTLRFLTMITTTKTSIQSRSQSEVLGTNFVRYLSIHRSDMVPKGVSWRRGEFGQDLKNEGVLAGGPA